MIPQELTLFRDKIAKLVPLNGLSQKDFNVLMESIEIVRKTRGETLFVEKNIDNRHYYLLQGTVQIRNGKGETRTLEAASMESLRPLAHAQPRKHTAIASSDILCVAFDSRSLEMMVNWAQTGDYEIKELRSNANDQPRDWMESILCQTIFQQLPPRNLQRFFTHLEQISAPAGTEVITQGDAGDYYYMLIEGRAQVLRNTPSNSRNTVIAELEPGQGFGEDALISGQPRSATVQMLSDGRLARLSKSDFKTLIEEPSVQTISIDDARDLVEQRKATWIDVRLPSEHAEFQLPDSQNLPLLYLRLKMASLNPQQNYIVYCDKGKRSAAGAFILRNHGLSAQVLDGGLQSLMAQANTAAAG